MKGGAYLTRKYIESIEWARFNPNAPLYKSINSNFVFNDINYADFDWIEKQFEYIYGLPERERDLLRFYTWHGDEFVNNYLRGSLTQTKIDALIQKVSNNLDFVKKIFNTTENININNINENVRIYISDLSAIINAAPKLTKPIKLYRGLKNMTHFNSNPYIEKGFLSTTLYLPSTGQFMSNNCCLLDITVQPGTPCLFIAPVSRKAIEFEVLFNTNMMIKISPKPVLKYFVDYPDFHKTNEVFSDPNAYGLEKKKVYDSILSS